MESKNAKVDSKDPEYVSIVDAESPSIRSQSLENLRILSEFELHYGLEGSNVISILKMILQDLSSHRSIHNWDEKFTSDPIKEIASASQKLIRHSFQTGSHLSNCCTAYEVSTVNGVNRRHFSNYLLSEFDTNGYFPAAKKKEARTQALQSNNNAKTPVVAHGRIVSTMELIPYTERATVLLIHAFCIRLQDEDFTFIQSFIRRHLRLKAAYKKPYRLQDTTPSDSSNVSYKRVSLSFHLPHLLLQSWEDSSQELEALDRELLGIFSPDPRLRDDERPGRLYRASSSVLLSLVVPINAESHEEAVDLLTVPEALWTVLLVNGSIHAADGFPSDPVEFLTPLTQFVRGVCGAVKLQRMHVSMILEGLKKQLLEYTRQSPLQPSGTAHLFDDQSFSSSKLYHWIIRTCYEVNGSLEVTLKFIRRFEKTSLAELEEKAHAYEKRGLAHWTVRLREETEEIDAVQSEVHLFKEQVRELREALYGATALLESRIAAMQGDKIRLLTYISMAYLPITTVTSLYSMNVLPTGATLGSFFIVLIVVLLITLLLAFNLRHIFSRLLRGQQQASTFIHSLMQQSTSTKWRNFQLNPPSEISYEYKPSNGNRSSFLSFLSEYLTTELPQKELSYGLSLFRPIRVPFYMKVRFSYRKLIGDLLRLLFLPLWIVMVTGTYSVQLAHGLLLRLLSSIER